MEQRSEPTTEEIVRALGEIVDCAWDAFAYGNISTRVPTVITIVIDAKRTLKSQQREIERLTAERDAEKARADAAEKDISRDCKTCENLPVLYDRISPCRMCVPTKSNWKWRGEKGKATE